MTKLTYSASTKPGQGVTFPDCKIVKGFNGEVRRGDRLVRSSGLFGTQQAAARWATGEAARYRAYRQHNGEGIEDIADRKSAAKKAEHRRIERRRSKGGAIYELLTLMVSDAELVREWLPDQAVARIAKARELIAFVETDPPK